MGSEGNGEGQFTEPSDIAIDKQNSKYVVDYRNRVVQKFDKNGKFLLSWGSTGVKDGGFAGIYSVAINPDGNVLVADESGRIQRFDSDSKFLSKISLPPLDNLFPNIWNIAIDDHGDIYFVDHNGFRIMKLDSRGEVITAWRGKDIGAAPFNSHQDIAVDEQGNIYITDSATTSSRSSGSLHFVPDLELICPISKFQSNYLEEPRKKLALLLFVVILLTACQPAATSQATAIPPTEPPAPTPPSAPVETLASSINDLAGVWWFPKIGMIEFKVDGTSSVSFGGTLVDEGTYTFDNGKVTWLDTSGTCKDKPATYEAYVARQDGKPVQLRIEVVGSDPCSDRANALSSPGKFQHP